MILLPSPDGKTGHKYELIVVTVKILSDKDLYVIFEFLFMFWPNSRPFHIIYTNHFINPPSAFVYDYF